MKLEGKVALITGGASGMGKASSLLFAKEGAKVMVSDINDKNGEETIEEIKNRILYPPVKAHFLLRMILK